MFCALRHRAMSLVGLTVWMSFAENRGAVGSFATDLLSLGGLSVFPSFALTAIIPAPVGLPCGLEL